MDWDLHTLASIDANLANGPADDDRPYGMEERFDESARWGDMKWQIRFCEPGLSRRFHTTDLGQRAIWALASDLEACSQRLGSHQWTAKQKRRMARHGSGYDAARAAAFEEWAANYWPDDCDGSDDFSYTYGY